MLIQAALNGGTSRAEHPAVPRTPAELAASAREAKLAGATVIHIHPRDSYGAQTLVAEHVLAAVAAVREATGLPVGVTTAIWTVDGEPARRLELVRDWAGRPGGREALPGPVGRGSTAGAGWPGKHSSDRPDFVSINLNEPGIEPLADLVTSLGIGIEAGVWTVDDARQLGSCSFRDRLLRVVLEPVDRIPSGAVATASETSAELRRLGIDAPQVHHGYGLATWHVLRAAVVGGFGLRVGLEDTPFLPDGTVASGNGALIAAAVALTGSLPAATAGSCWLHSPGGGMVVCAGNESIRRNPEISG